MSRKMLRSGHAKCAMRIGRSPVRRACGRLNATALALITPRPVFRLSIALP
jgi:hypothetical protein